jgi:hypothetical protein
LKQIHKRLTYANVMSSIAVFLVLGGAAVAATTLDKNSVGSKQLKKESVGSAKIKKNAVNSSKVQDGSLEATDFKAGQLPAGPKGETGAKGATGAPGSAVAYAHVLSNGTIETGSGKNLTNANITHPATGVYCFDNLSFTVHVVTVSPDAFGPTDGILVNPTFPGVGLSGCEGTNGGRVRTTTVAAPSTPANNPFFIVFE